MSSAMASLIGTGATSRTPSSSVSPVRGRWSGVSPSSGRRREWTSSWRPSRSVLDDLPEARVAVIGNGVLREGLQRQARALGLNGRLRFFDYLGPSVRQLQSLDVYVHPPPRYEPFGIGLVEAMACGVPQVTTAVGGAAEVVGNGETGLFCRPNDKVDLAEQIVRLLKDDGLRARMSEASRERHRTVLHLQSHGQRDGERLRSRRRGLTRWKADDSGRAPSRRWRFEGRLGLASPHRSPARRPGTPGRQRSPPIRTPWCFNRPSGSTACVLSAGMRTPAVSTSCPREAPGPSPCSPPESAGVAEHRGVPSLHLGSGRDRSRPGASRRQTSSAFSMTLPAGPSSGRHCDRAR